MAMLRNDPELDELVRKTMADVQKERAKNKLRDLHVNRVDIVDKVSNQEARIVFYKQDSNDKEMNDLDKAYDIANKMTEAGKANSVPEALLRMSYMAQHKALLRSAMTQLPTPPPTLSVTKQRNPELTRIEKAAQALLDAGDVGTLTEATHAVCKSDPDAYWAYAASVAGRRE